MSEPITLDPIFGTMFGDHASECRCDRCEEHKRKSAEFFAGLAAVRTGLDEIAIESGAWGRCNNCRRVVDEQTLGEDGVCRGCEYDEDEP